MTAKFDAKTQARSLSRILDMAEVTITKAGGAIHTERLVDYVSEEFAKLTVEQQTSVLTEMDKGYEKNLLKDGYGRIIGYAHSKKIFVTFRPEGQSNHMSVPSNGSSAQSNPFMHFVKEPKGSSGKKSSKAKDTTHSGIDDTKPAAKSNKPAKTIVTTKHAAAAKPAAVQKAASSSRRKSAAKITGKPVKRARIKDNS